VRAETSRDHESGFTYGYAIYGMAQSGAPTLRVDRYIAFWRRETAGWRIAGYAETYGSPPPAITLPAVAADSVVADVPMSRQRDALEAIRAADTDFSRDATKFGTGARPGRRVLWCGIRSKARWPGVATSDSRWATRCSAASAKMGRRSCDTPST
jgi:hypothetical protein